MAVPAGSATDPVIIRLKPGTYKELIYVQREKRFFYLVGEDAEKTVLTYDLKGQPCRQGRQPHRHVSHALDAD